MDHNSSLSALVHDARAFLGLGIDEVKGLLGPAVQPVPGEEYQNLKDLTSLENQNVFPGIIYLKNGAVELIRVGRSELASFDRAALLDEFGDGAFRLRSRAGKRAHLLVFARQGIACSVSGEQLDYLEVFRPCTQQEYRAHIHLDPGPFIR